MPSMDEIKAFVRLHLKQRAYDYPAPDETLGVVSLGYEPETFAKTINGFADRFDVVEELIVPYKDTRRPIFTVSTRTANPSKKLLIVSGIHGNEQAGIPDELAEQADALARIPQAGRADSLNLAIATGIMLFEARRHLLSLDASE